MSSNGHGSVLKMELIEMVAKQVREDLERDALRTIRQKDTEKGKACLDKIEGVDQFMDAIMRACAHGFYKQAGLVIEEQVPVIRAHAARQKVSAISARRKSGA
jgi:hypothetical protein